VEAVTIRLEWSAPVRPPGNASVVIRAALVPMLLWPSVPVTRRVDQDLTIVDRFIVEAALSLSPMRAEDVAEVTGIPPEAIARVAGRLTGLGLLRADGDSYRPLEEAARTALARQTVAEYRTAYVTFLYLPQGDDLFAFPPGPGQPDPPLLKKAPPVAAAPVPARIAGRNRAELLRERIVGGRVAGLPEDIVDAVDGEDTVPPVCQAYQCRGHVRSQGDDATLVLRMFDGAGKSVAQCTLAGAAGQAARWAALAAQAGSVGQRWESAGGAVAAVQEADTTWSFTLDGIAANAAARDGVALSKPVGLAVHDDDCVVYVDATFAPADPVARHVFALHHAVRAIADTAPAQLHPDAVETATAAARKAYELDDNALTGTDVADRLWNERHYRHVYAVRSSRDFAYD
jgi:hypothetical protein